jgi:hypothetical protein
MIDAYVAPVEQLRAVATEFLDMRKARESRSAMEAAKRRRDALLPLEPGLEDVAPLSIPAPRG